jgi:hypothetical protein
MATNSIVFIRKNKPYKIEARKRGGLAGKGGDATPLAGGVAPRGFQRADMEDAVVVACP